MSSKATELLKEASKYGVVGVLGTIVDIAIFNAALLVSAGYLGEPEPVSAKIISTVLSAAGVYVLHGGWTFKNRGGDRRKLGTIALFGFVTVAGLLISVGIVAFSHYSLGFTSITANNVANGLALLVSATFRFFATRHLVFRGRRETPDEAKKG